MSEPVLTIRRGEPDDLSPLSFFCDTALRRDYFLRRGQLAEMLRGDRHEVYIAEIDGVLVGLAVLTRPGRLVNVLVHPAYRGLGIGRCLVVTAGPREVRVKTDMSSGDPRPFYRRLGFRPSGERNARGNIEVFRATGAAAARPSTSS